MSNYEDRINKALEYLKSPRLLNPTGHNPIAYLIYDPKDAMAMSKMAQGYIQNKANYLGFKPVLISFGKLLNDYISNKTDRHSLWSMVDSNQEELLFNSMRQDIENEKYFENAFLNIQEEHISEPKTLFIITDVELIHPFYLMGTFEANVYNNIKLPVLVLYPGERQGIARSFLSIYNQDGNYRSVNF